MRVIFNPLTSEFDLPGLSQSAADARYVKLDGDTMAGSLTISNTTGDSLTINGTGTANSLLRFKDDGVERGAIFSVNANSDFTVRSQQQLVLAANNAGTIFSARLNGTGMGLGRSASNLLDMQSSATGALVALRNGSGNIYFSVDNSNTDATPNARLTLYRGTTISGTILATAANGLFINSTVRVDWAIGGTTVFQSNSATLVTYTDAVNMAFGSTTGTKLGTSTSQKIGLWNATPVVQPSTTGELTGFTANASANAVFNESTFTGNLGTKAYTFSDVVKHLKTIGLLAAS